MHAVPIEADLEPAYLTRFDRANWLDAPSALLRIPPAAISARIGHDLLHLVQSALRLLPELRHRPTGSRPRGESGQLAEMMLHLQQRGCHNINFLTPSVAASRGTPTMIGATISTSEGIQLRFRVGTVQRGHHGSDAAGAESQRARREREVLRGQPTVRGDERPERPGTNRDQRAGVVEHAEVRARESLGEGARQRRVNSAG
jgi:hypothetical protein